MRLTLSGMTRLVYKMSTSAPPEILQRRRGISRGMYAIGAMILVCLVLVVGAKPARHYLLHLPGFAERGFCEIKNATEEYAFGGKRQIPPYECQVKQALADYKTFGFSYKNNLQSYTVFGDWLNFGETENWDPSDRHFDAEGLPRNNYGGRALYYNPVDVSLYALSMHGRYIRGDSSARQRFFVAVRKLLLMQDPKGAFRYRFRWKYYLSGETYEPGWASGMAQGLALSVLARAYHLSGDPNYLNAGDKAFDFLVTKVSDGGVMNSMAELDPALSRYITFDEYPAKPSGYTLNGFMYAVLGIYDWSQVSHTHAQEAKEYFRQGTETVKVILPYYDIGGFSAYDLGHITYHRRPNIGVNYHAVHIFLLHALASLTGDRTLKEYELRWASYVSQ